MSHLLELVQEADRDGNGKIDYGEWEIMGTSEVVGVENTALTVVGSPAH